MNTYFNAITGFWTGLPGTPEQHTTYFPSAQEEVNAVRVALDVGYTVFDTAEKYRDGLSESFLGEGLKQSAADRSKLHIVSKVLPSHAQTKEQIIKSCQASLRRVNCDYFDTYLLHWRQPITMPLEPVIEGFLELQRMGLIKNYGVSNFTRLGGMLEWQRIEKSLTDQRIKINQVHYSLGNREIEKDMIPHCSNTGVTIMAHSVLNPLRNKNLLTNEKYLAIANAHGYNPSQLAIAWTLRQPNIMSLVRSTKPDRIKSNWDAQFIPLTEDVLKDLETI